MHNPPAYHDFKIMLGMGGEHGAGKMMVGCLYQNAAVSVLALHLEDILNVDICELW